jgi:hypothetical protein
MLQLAPGMLQSRCPCPCHPMVSVISLSVRLQVDLGGWMSAGGLLAGWFGRLHRPWLEPMILSVVALRDKVGRGVAPIFSAILCPKLLANESVMLELPSSWSAVSLLLHLLPNAARCRWSRAGL